MVDLVGSQVESGKKIIKDPAGNDIWHLAERAIIPPETVFCTRSAVARATDGLLT